MSTLNEVTSLYQSSCGPMLTFLFLCVSSVPNATQIQVFSVLFYCGPSSALFHESCVRLSGFHLNSYPSELIAYYVWSQLKLQRTDN